MKKIKYILLTLGLIFSFGLAATPVSVGAASSAFDKACADAPDSPVCKDRVDADAKARTFIKTLVNTLLYILGAVSVVVIIFAGIFYTTSIGDQALITKAKNTLLYAVIGLIVALIAYAIVNFVIDSFK